MHITAGVVLLVVLGSGARGVSSGNGRPESALAARTDKRALAEGNASLDKRTTGLNGLPQAPGIEYAESKEPEPDNSPAQQVYSTQRPPTVTQVSKVSDVLSGQQGPVSAAIASQLYSPVQLYHGRAGAGVPTTYELSAPVASQLAYSEHNVYLEPQSNSIQYYTQPQKVQAQSNPPVTRFTFNYPQQPVTYEPQPIFYQQPPVPQQIFQYTPQLNYNQQHLEYIRSQAPQVFVQPAQPGIAYAQKGSDVAFQSNYVAQEAPREVKIVAPAKVVEKTTLQPVQIQTDKPSGAVSFASFSQSQPKSSYIPTSNNYVRVNAKLEAPNNNPQIQKQAPLTLYVSKGPVRYYSQPQPFQALISPQLYQQEPQLQYQPHFYSQSQLYAPSQQNAQPQLHSQPQLHPQPQLNAQTQLHSQHQLQVPTQLHPQPQLNAQPQLHPQPQLNAQPQLHPQPQRLFVQSSPQPSQQYVGVPTFPPVQYFGKFAPQIFGNYQH